MAAVQEDDLTGVVARLHELVAVRPHQGRGGLGALKARSQLLGAHRSMVRGRGMEFDEVRAYQPGDDVRTIDWRVTARTGKTHTKLFQEERERPVLLLVDARSFMRFGTRDCFKSVLAARAAAMLSWTALDAGDRVGGVILTPFTVSAHRPQRSRAGVLAFVKAVAEATSTGFDAPPPAAEPRLSEALRRLRQVSRPGTLAFILSDFHDVDDAALKEFGRLSQHCAVSTVFVFDPLEAAPPPRGRFRVSDGEGVGLLDADRAGARDAYVRRFAERRAAVEEIARQRGMAFLPLEAGSDPAALLSGRAPRAPLVLT